MKQIGTVIAALALASAGTTAIAGQDVQQAKPQAVKMTDAQLDTIAAGQVIIGPGLVTVTVGDVDVAIPVSILDNGQVQVAVPIGAGIGAGVLGQGVGGGVAGALGRQNR
jgi:hypothetical protein